MLEGHALAVVDADDDLASVTLADGEPHVAGAGVAGVLQQLPDKNPRIRAVAVGFEARALAKGLRAGHDAGRGP